MHSGELQQRGNAVEEAHQQKPVEGCGVFDFGQIGARVQADRGEREHSRHAETDAIAGRLAVYPEGDPRQHHN